MRIGGRGIAAFITEAAAAHAARAIAIGATAAAIERDFINACSETLCEVIVQGMIADIHTARVL